MENPVETPDVIVAKPFVVGHLLIRDPGTGDVMVNQRDGAQATRSLADLARASREETGRKDT